MTTNFKLKNFNYFLAPKQNNFYTISCDWQNENHTINNNNCFSNQLFKKGLTKPVDEKESVGFIFFYFSIFFQSILILYYILSRSIPSRSRTSISYLKLVHVKNNLKQLSYSFSQSDYILVKAFVYQKQMKHYLFSVICFN
jgi:hypothetical protein